MNTPYILKRYRLSLAIAQRPVKAGLDERRSVRRKIGLRWQGFARGARFCRISRIVASFFAMQPVLLRRSGRTSHGGFVRGSKKCRTAPVRGLRASNNCRIENL
ncbi:MAG: hypothetical protein E5X84_23375 [Mesorhizobium sp.]|nr:MAG: hypothetical protein E5X84_23375 [Mesorhizobium sp.]